MTQRISETGPEGEAMAIKARNPISPHGRGNAPIGPGGKGRRAGPACVTLAAWAEPVQHRGFLTGPGLN